ncbi:MAG: histidine kinase [Acidobacteria bacterium]|nr:histidine kinase [Acidobacteriota bacterium]
MTRLWTLLPRTLLMGLGLGTLLWAVKLSGDFRVSVTICTIFAVVMWCGFELFHGWYQPRPGRPPEREALRSMGVVSLMYTVMLALCVGLIRLTTGVDLLIHPAVAAMTFAIGFAITNFMMAKHALVHVLEAEGARAQAEARAGLLALQAQLQPHTLFNALNTIAALIPEEPAKAEAATEALSRLLRRIMSALEQERWTLAEEFSVLEDLLALERLRFGARLDTKLELAPEDAGREVPPLLLLPLVENALKHGFRPKVGTCHLRVDATGGRVRIADDGVGRDPAAPEGLGVRTVRERLEALGGRLAWPETGVGCAVEVTLP